MFTLSKVLFGRAQGNAANVPADRQRTTPRSVAKSLLRVGAGIAVAAYIQWRNDQPDVSHVAAPVDSPFVAVDNDTRILHRPNFLSAEEIEYLLKFVENLGGWAPSGIMKHMDLPPEGYIAAARKDPVFARVEQRIANCTGIPVHPHEDIVSLSRLTSHGVSPRDGYFPPYGLHHDSHERPHRAWTVIVYLQAPETGGRTIFPLAGHQSDQRHREFASALQELFGGARKNYSRQALFDVKSDHPFMDLIEEGCRGENGLAFQPQPGSALLFPSDSRSFRTWHAGCNVINGTKIILQKFKEYPLPQRTDASAEIPYQSFAEPSLA